jgi:hypothetical protein
VPGVDHGEDSGAQVEPAENPGDERGPVRGVIGERLIRGLCLLEQGAAAAAGVAQAADTQRRGQCTVHTVADGIGDAEMKQVPGEAVVEGVPTDTGRRLKPRREGERVGFTGERRGQQPPLYLRGERERRRSLPPFEQVGMPTVGDHHECQGVRRPRHPAHDRLRWCDGQRDLQQSDGLPALGDRRPHHELVTDLFDQHLLGTQRLLLRAAVELQHHGDVLVLPAAAGQLTERHVDQTDQCATAHIRHQKRHPHRVQAKPDAAGHRLHRVDRGSLLHRKQHLVEIHTAHPGPGHPKQHRGDQAPS